MINIMLGLHCILELIFCNATVETLGVAYAGVLGSCMHFLVL